MHTRQTIVTKYLPATNTKGTRLKATAQAGFKIYSWDDAIGTDENHFAAAKAFADSKGWGPIHGFGQLPDGNYVATFAWSK